MDSKKARLGAVTAIHRYPAGLIEGCRDPIPSHGFLLKGDSGPASGVLSKPIGLREAEPTASTRRLVPAVPTSLMADVVDETEAIEIEVSFGDCPLPLSAAPTPFMPTRTDAFESAPTRAWQRFAEGEACPDGSATRSAYAPLKRSIIWMTALGLLALSASAWRVGPAWLIDLRHRAGSQVTGLLGAAKVPSRGFRQEVSVSKPNAGSPARQVQEVRTEGELSVEGDGQESLAAPTPAPAVAAERTDPSRTLRAEALSRANGLVRDARKHQRRGNLAAALASYEKALSLVPRYPRAMFGVAETLLAQGEKRRAYDTMMSLLELRSRFPDDHRLLADIYVAMGNTEDAIEAYRLASEEGSRLARDKLRSLR